MIKINYIILFKKIDFFIPNKKMVKKIKINKNSKEFNNTKENKNLSSLIKNTRIKLFSKRINNFTEINTSVAFKINSNSSLQEKYEKEYRKRYLFYIKEEFNSKVITMFFNYISSTNIIPTKFKNNRYFLKEFLKIIIDLLINEIDLVTMTLILDNIGWINEGSDPWLYIYYICLYAKENASSENSFSILTQILEKNNPGFNDSFNKWSYKINNNKKMKIIDISKTNERFRELIKPLYLNEEQKKFINYNEIVNKIVSMNKQKENVTPLNQINNRMTRNNNNLISNNLFNPTKSIQYNPIENLSLHSNLNLNINNKYESPVKSIPQNLDIQQNNSFKLLDLSRAASRNSFMGLSSFDGELYKMPSMKFINK